MTIAQLERATGLRRRTIHYYTQSGLLPAPRGAGRAARYGEPHLLRLRLIPLFKAGGLRLDHIATALAALTEDQMRNLLAARATDPADPCGMADWLSAARRATPRTASAPSPRARAVGSTAGPAIDAPTDAVAYGAPAPSRWERYPVSPQVEIHVRGDADPALRERLEALRRYAARLCAPGD